MGYSLYIVLDSSIKDIHVIVKNYTYIILEAQRHFVEKSYDIVALFNPDVIPFIYIMTQTID